jgi:hypothetical protein
LYSPDSASASILSSHQDFPGGFYPYSLSINDFNEDNLPDLAVTNFFNAILLTGNGDGTFSNPVSFPAGDSPNCLAAEDFNEDTHLDLIVTNTVPSSAAVLLGNGAGGFGAPTMFTLGGVIGSVDIVCEDFDGDGHADVAVANTSDNVSVLLGDGTGGFSPPTIFAAGATPKSLTTADFNEDTFPDLAIANYATGDPPGDGTVSILLGNGAGSFSGPTNLSAGGGPVGILSGDLDGDTHQDIAFSDYDGGRIGVLLGNGDGSFSSVQFYAVGATPTYMATGDFDKDLVPDLAVSSDIDGGLWILDGLNPVAGLPSGNRGRGRCEPGWQSGYRNQRLHRKHDQPSTR